MQYILQFTVIEIKYIMFQVGLTTIRVSNANCAIEAPKRVKIIAYRGEIGLKESYMYCKCSTKVDC